MIKNISDLISPTFWKTIDPISKKEIEYFKSMQKYQVLVGGRMSFKSITNAQKILLLLMKYPYVDWIYVRTKKNTNYRTTFPTIIEACEILGLKNGRDYFAPINPNVHKTLYFELRNGSTIQFDGLIRDADDSKGIKPTTTGKSVIGGITFFEADQMLRSFDDYAEGFSMIENYVSSFNRMSFSKLYSEKPFWIISYEWNPPGNKNHNIYEYEKYLRKLSNSTVFTVRYYDHPKELLLKWLGAEALANAENLKNIDYEQWKSVYGGLPAKLNGGCYPKFSLENDNIKQVPMTPEYIQKNYDYFVAGVDTGTTDATVFTFIGIKFRNGMVPKVGFINRYYWKNNHTVDEESGLKEIRDVNDHAKQFHKFTVKNSGYIGRHRAYDTFFESADPGSQLIYDRHLSNHPQDYKTNILSINKKPRKKQKEKSAIQERVDFGNILLNGAEIEFNINENTLGVATAFEDAKYDKNGNRADDNSTDIDSLDSLEYALLDSLVDLEEAIIMNYKTGGR